MSEKPDIFDDPQVVERMEKLDKLLRYQPSLLKSLSPEDRYLHNRWDIRKLTESMREYNKALQLVSAGLRGQ